MFENLKIRQRLKKAFAIIVVISSIEECSEHWQ